MTRTDQILIEVAPNPNEIMLGTNELIISKIDVTGKITYANREFMRGSDFPASDILGQNHNFIRHPDMPRGVYYGLWQTLKSGSEFFGFYSVRRQATASMIAHIIPLYNEMLRIEKATKRELAPSESWQSMQGRFAFEHHISYHEFVINKYERNI